MALKHNSLIKISLSLSVIASFFALYIAYIPKFALLYPIALLPFEYFPRANVLTQFALATVSVICVSRTLLSGFLNILKLKFNGNTLIFVGVLLGFLCNLSSLFVFLNFGETPIFTLDSLTVVCAIILILKSMEHEPLEKSREKIAEIEANFNKKAPENDENEPKILPKTQNIDEFNGENKYIFAFCMVIIVISFLYFYLIFIDFNKALIFLSSVCFLVAIFGVLIMGFSLCGASVSFALKNNISFRNKQNFLQMIDIKNVIFNMSGILTQGELSLCEIAALDISETSLITYTASIMANIDSEIVSAIVKSAKDKKINIKKIDYKIIENKYIKSEIENKNVLIGDKNFLQKSGIDIGVCNGIELNYTQKGYEVLWVSIGEKVSGALAFGDKVNKDSKKTIRILNSLAIKPYIFSDKNYNITHKIASEINVPDFFSSLSNKEKMLKLKEIEAENSACVVNSIDDLGLIKECEFKIAMENAPKEIIENAHGIILDNSLQGVYNIFYIGQKLLKSMKTGLVFSCVYLILGIVISVFLSFYKFGIDFLIFILPLVLIIYPIFSIIQSFLLKSNKSANMQFRL